MKTLFLFSQSLSISENNKQLKFYVKIIYNDVNKYGIWKNAVLKIGITTNSSIYKLRLE